VISIWYNPADSGAPLPWAYAFEDQQEFAKVLDVCTLSTKFPRGIIGHIPVIRDANFIRGILMSSGPLKAFNKNKGGSFLVYIKDTKNPYPHILAIYHTMIFMEMSQTSINNAIAWNQERQFEVPISFTGDFVADAISVIGSFPDASNYTGYNSDG
jgi:hypothetical protein